jgi:hypothetical protein
MSNGLEVLKAKSSSLSAIKYLMKHSGVTIDMLVADQFLSEHAKSLSEESNVTVADNVIRDMAMDNVDFEDLDVWMEELGELVATFLFLDSDAGPESTWRSV